ncbi:hypothetical protein KQI30_12505 [Clostridium bornimense]|uniref:cohesin domain-containing protein n=1 Tax=Clostridium bornimense TaxID=1216932 RepID=UPI001C10866E|nr:cohesin domain-containing protein [Clostridium bornimense]MBU5317071.1 hypothetical protein [Clostridium bornimense]
MKLQMFNINNSTSSNVISGKFKIINTDSNSVNLSDIKIRYYYTIDSKREQNFWCDYSSMNVGYNNTSITDKVVGTFCKLDTVLKGADYYLEVGFKTDAPMLPSGGTAEIQWRFAKADWTNYDQNNDYSFNGSATGLVDWDKVILLVKDVVVSGEVPTEEVIIPPEDLNPKIKVEMFNVNTLITSNSITPKIRVTNIGNIDINLSKLKLRYYFTSDNNKLQQFWCDYANVQGNGYKSITSSVSGEFVNFVPSQKNVDSYLEISFNDEVTSLEVGGILEAQIRFAKVDWSNFDQSNDYSFNSTASNYIEWSKVTGYVNGNLVWGDEPSGQGVILDSEISPIEAVVDLNSPEDIVITMTLNGNVFKGIDGLVEGKDFVLKGNVVTLNKSYLETLVAGTVLLRFNFSAGSSKILTLLVKAKEIPAGDNLIVTIDSKEAMVGETITIPVTISGITEKGLNANNFALKYDKEIFENVEVEPGEICVNSDLTFVYNVDKESGVIYVMYCDSTGEGLEAITTDGVFMNIKATVKEDAKAGTTEITVEDKGVFADIDMKVYDVEFILGIINIKEKDIPPIEEKKLSVEITSMSGKQGSKIIIPVVVSGIDKDKLNAFNFALSYDKAIFENVAVEAGEVAVNPTLTFVSNVDAESGTIYVMYCDSTGDGTEAIASDGVIMNVILSIKEDATSGTTEVKVSDNGVFADINSVVYTTTFKNGVITILEKEVPPVVEDKFTLAIESSKGKAGDEVIIPLVLKNVPDSGIANFDFKIKYDGNILDVTSVSAGSIVTNPKLNFKYNVNTSSNLIYVTFIDFEAYGNDLIKEDGDLVNITFKVKEDALSEKTIIATSGDVNFADYDGNTLEIIFKEGSIEIA